MKRSLVRKGDREIDDGISQRVDRTVSYGHIVVTLGVTSYGIEGELGNVCQYRVARSLKQISAKDGLPHRTELRRIITRGNDKFPSSLNHGDYR
jgi:hypothetical protein